MKRKPTKADRVLEWLLSPDFDPWAEESEVNGCYGERGPLPAEWIEPLFKACLDRSRDREQRASLLELFERMPQEDVVKAVKNLFDVDDEVVLDAVRTGNPADLLYWADSLLPGYDHIPVVKNAVQQVLDCAIDGNGRAEASFLDVDEDAVEWLDDPATVPVEYDVPNTCATCSSFKPTQISDEGVLGECATHSAELGLFSHKASCDDWTKRG